MRKTNKGKEGENKAAEFLEKAGMQILARNFRSPVGEVDIIALEKETIVFVEVKTWFALGIEELQYSISKRKQSRIIETANYFLNSQRKYSCMAVRFDVIFIGPAAITHLAGAFMESV